MKVLLFCGGADSRFWPVSGVTQKSLLHDINGKPIIRNLVDRLTAPDSPFQSKDIVILCANKHLKSFQHEFRDTEVQYDSVPLQLGTVGHLVKAIIDNPDTSYLVHYTDMVTDINYDRLVASHTNKSTIVTTKIRGDYGVVDMKYDNNSKTMLVTDFVEKPIISTPTYTGVMLLNLDQEIRQILNKVYSLYADADISKHLIPELVEKKYVSVFNHEGTWIDLGTLSKYIKYANFV